MNTPTTFLYYAAETNEWQKTTLEELATLNDPDLNIIPIDPQGNYGQQTTWSAWQEQNKQPNLNPLPPQKKHNLLDYIFDTVVVAPAPPPTQPQPQDQQKAEQERQTAARQQQQLQQQAQQHQHTNLQEIRDEITNADIRSTCKLIRYVCRLICITFWLGLVSSSIIIGIIVAGEKYILAGIVAGIIVAALIIFIIETAISEWERATAKSPNTPPPAQE